MQLLKSVVIGLGILILLGMALLTYGLYQKANDPGWRLFSRPAPAEFQAPATATPAAPDAKAFGTLGLHLPDGCFITAVRPDGGRVYLTIGPPGPCNRIVIVDVIRGRELGTIQPHP